MDLLPNKHFVLFGNGSNPQATKTKLFSMLKYRQMLEKIKRHFILPKDLLVLVLSRSLMRISFSSLSLFVPIYFYKLYSSVEIAVFVFATVYLLQVLLLPLVSKMLSVWGMKPMMIAGLFFASLVPISLLATENAELAGVLFVIFSAFYRALFWTPYHIDFAELLSPTSRGKELALVRNLSNVLFIASPIVGGVLISTAGFSATFMYAALVMIFAIVPLFFLGNHFEHYSWRYLETFTHLFKPENRNLLIAHAANGAQSAATLVFWPLFLGILLDERYTAVGLITALTLLLVMFLRYVTGVFFDKFNKEKVVFVGVLLTATGWVFKTFIQTPFEVFVVDTYHRFGRTVNAVAFDAETYEQAADSGKYIDEYTVLKEIALNLGRVAMLIVTLFFVSIWGIKASFAIAAVLTILMIFLNRFSRVS